MLSLLLLNCSLIILGSVSCIHEWTVLLLDGWFYCFVQPSLVSFQRPKVSSGVDSPQMVERADLPSRYELYNSVNIYEYLINSICRKIWHYDIPYLYTDQLPDQRWFTRMLEPKLQQSLLEKSSYRYWIRNSSAKEWAWGHCCHLLILLHTARLFLKSNWKFAQRCMSVETMLRICFSYSLSCFFCFCSLNCMVSWCLSVRSWLVSETFHQLCWLPIKSCWTWQN